MVTAMAMAQRRTLFIWNISIVYPGVAVFRNVIQPKEIQGKLMYTATRQKYLLFTSSIPYGPPLAPVGVVGPQLGILLELSLHLPNGSKRSQILTDIYSSLALSICHPLNMKKVKKPPMYVCSYKGHATVNIVVKVV